MALTRPVRLERGIDFPEPALASRSGFHRGGPLLAETDFVDPVIQRERRHQQHERREQEAQRVIQEERLHDAEHFDGDAAAASMLSENASAAGAQAREEVDNGPRSGHFGVGEAHPEQGVRIAAGDTDFAEPGREPFGVGIGFLPHLTVAGLVGGHVGLKPAEVLFRAPASEAREDVIHAEEQLPFRQIHKQGEEVGAALLDLEVVLFGQAIDAQVHFRAAGHADGHFFAEEEVGVRPQTFGGLDGVMVGKSDDGHPSFFQEVIDFMGIVVGLPAKAVENGSGEHSGSDRMNMKVASHGVNFEWGI